jgi:Tol biopolymer transport system component
MRKLLCLSLLLFLVAAWVGCGDSHKLVPTSNVLFIRAGVSATASMRHAMERGGLFTPHALPSAAGRPFVLAGGSDSVVMMKNDGSNQKVLTSQGGTTGTFGAVQFSLDGKMAVGTALDENGHLQIFVVSMANLNNLQPTQVTKDNEDHYFPQLSPDNKTVLFVKEDATTYMPQAFTVKTSGGTETHISTPGVYVNFPSYTPDGKHIVFEEEENDTIDIMNPDGTGIKKLTDGTFYDEMPSVTPDGKKIFFSRYGKATEMAGEEIFSMNIDGTGLKQLTTTGDKGDSWDPLVVNDKLVYCFNDKMYGMNLDGTGQKGLTNSSQPEFFMRD